MTHVLLSIVAATIVGSAHCTSMCGGLAAFAASGTGSTPQKAAALAAYSGARGLGYATLGAFAGAFGSTLDRVGIRVGVGRVAGALAAVVMIGWGLTKVAELAGARLPFARAPRAVLVPVAGLVRRLREEPPALRAAAIGGCTAALPCGFLHMFLVSAAGTGTAFDGALVMAAFWLGTVPAVVGVGLGAELFARSLRRHASLVGALVMVGFGLSSLFGRWSPRSLLALGHDHPTLVSHGR